MTGAMVDALGQAHQVADSHCRIVSLVPSVTELLCDLGLAGRLVGRTGFCIHPAAALAAVPKVGGTKDVNIEKIRRLAPTHLIVNIDENEKPTVDLLASFVPHVIVTHPLTVRDNLPLYQLLGQVFGVEAAALRLSEELKCALAEIDALRAAHAKPRQVLYCIWRDPWMTVRQDTYIADMLRQIDWQQISIPGDDRRYPAFDWEALPPSTMATLDTVLLSTEPYRFQASDVHSLSAALGKPVHLVDGEMLSWYGSRAIAGVRYLAGLARC